MTNTPVRCPNCGYANDRRDFRCRRCNYPLNESNDDPNPISTPNTGPVKATMVGQSANTDPWDMNNSRPLNEQVAAPQPQAKPAAQQEPASGAQHPKAKKIDVNKTIDPSRVQLFEKNCIKLVRIPKEGENEVTLEFDSDSIVLTRDNTDPGNMTITSKEQAALIYRDGHWTIEDRSALKTTYLRISEPTPLKSGDVILLGNRAFRVEF